MKDKVSIFLVINLIEKIIKKNSEKIFFLIYPMTNLTEHSIFKKNKKQKIIAVPVVYSHCFTAWSSGSYISFVCFNLITHHLL